MDRLDRTLKHLPRHVPAPDLARRIRATVHRRYTRRLWLRRGAALAFVLTGLLISSPGLLAFLAGWSGPGTDWLMGSVSLLQAGSLRGGMQLWDAMAMGQDWWGSPQIVLAAAGVLLMTIGLFLGLDRRVFLETGSRMQGMS